MKDGARVDMIGAGSMKDEHTVTFLLVVKVRVIDHGGCAAERHFRIGGQRAPGFARAYVGSGLMSGSRSGLPRLLESGAAL